MSGTGIEDTRDQEFTDSTLKEQVDDAVSVEEQKELDKNNESSMHSPQQEEEIIKKKYGGIIPKKPPLISKDHERAFFDSADWALGKQGAQRPKGPFEALRPKLQPTHQQARSRRSAYAPADADDGEDDDTNHETNSKDQSCLLDCGDNSTTSKDLNSHE